MDTILTSLVMDRVTTGAWMDLVSASAGTDDVIMRGAPDLVIAIRALIVNRAGPQGNVAEDGIQKLDLREPDVT